MTLAAITSNTRRSATCTLDAAAEWGLDAYVPAGHLVDVSMLAIGFTGTVTIQRRVSIIGTYEILTDADGVDLVWTSDATFVLQSAAAYYYRASCLTRSAGAMNVVIRAGARV